MDRLSRGLLSGLKSGADEYSSQLKEKGKRDYESEKAATLYTRQQNMERIKNSNIVDREQTRQGYNVDNAATKFEYDKELKAMDADRARTGKENDRRVASELAMKQERRVSTAIALRDVPGFKEMSEEEQDSITSNITNERIASANTAGTAPSNTDINNTVKNAASAWETLSEDERDKYKNGLKQYTDEALNRLRGTSTYRYKTPEMLKNAEIVFAKKQIKAAGSYKEAMKLVAQADDEDKETFMQLVDEEYGVPKPTTTTNQDPVSGIERGGRIISNIFNAPTKIGNAAYDKVGEGVNWLTTGDPSKSVFDNNKRAASIDAPLRGLLGERPES